MAFWYKHKRNKFYKIYKKFYKKLLTNNNNNDKMYISKERKEKKMLKNSKNNTLYIIQFGKEKYYKIGITNNINKRIANLQVRKSQKVEHLQTIYNSQPQRTWKNWENFTRIF